MKSSSFLIAAAAGLVCVVSGCSVESDLKTMCEQATHIEASMKGESAEMRRVTFYETFSPMSSEMKELKAAIVGQGPDSAYDLMLVVAKKHGLEQWECPALRDQQKNHMMQQHSARCGAMKKAAGDVAKEIVPEFEAAVLRTVKKDIPAQKWAQFQAVFDREKVAGLSTPDPNVTRAFEDTLQAFGCGEEPGEPTPGACQMLETLTTTVTDGAHVKALGGAFATAMMETEEITAAEIAGGSKRFEDLLTAAATEGVEVSKKKLGVLVRVTECNMD